MKTFLLHIDRDFDMKQAWPWNASALTQDLELNILFEAMANGDEVLAEVVRKVIFSGPGNDAQTIEYRQEILADCLKIPDVIKSLFDIAVETLESRRTSWYNIYSKHPTSILSSSVGMMNIYLEMLKKIRAIADQHAGKFESAGFKRFMSMTQAELSDDYFLEISHFLDQLKFNDGILVSAHLTKGNKASGYTLHRLKEKKINWLQKLFGRLPPGYTFYISPRDEAGARALAKLNDESLNQVANALAQSSDHIFQFFTTMRNELAFYIGCLNLKDHLMELNEPFCIPGLKAPELREHICEGLFDICLALNTKKKVIGNDLHASLKNLVIITGANQGGKSTFLRSIGQAQLMMQSGMFVPANTFSANICSNIFTHFKREEDNTMKSGKFDEELSRMSAITDHIGPDSLLLFNESFAATNEREGSEIARQIVNALMEKHLKVFYVTHLYDFAQSFFERNLSNVLFLRAERQSDSKRTYRLEEAPPLPTSYGNDLYKKYFEMDHADKRLATVN